jgi:hypothetical protein
LPLNLPPASLLQNWADLARIKPHKGPFFHYLIGLQWLSVYHQLDASHRHANTKAEGVECLQIQALATKNGIIHPIDLDPQFTTLRRTRIIQKRASPRPLQYLAGLALSMSDATANAA